jgi:tricorn protease-like protein
MKLAKILICIGLFSFNVMGDMAFSSMAARSSVTITAKETVAYYNAEKKKRKLTSDEIRNFSVCPDCSMMFLKLMILSLMIMRI